ncbi:MAG: SDR family oxidoreductase [Candidatus Aenigmatarchaeota archaeon]
MKIIITGGLGYLGAELSKFLERKGFKVYIIDSCLYKNFLNVGSSIIKEDVRRLSQRSIKLIKESDVIIHLAAIVGDPACDLIKEEAVDINLNGTKKIIILAKKYNKKLIFSSTCSVYGASKNLLTERSKTLPLSIYALTKLAAENYIERSKIDYVIFRMGTIFGLSDRMRFDLVLNKFVADAVIKKKITIFGGNQWRPFLYMKDAIEFYYKTIENNCFPKEIFNISSFNIKILKLGQLISKNLGCEMDIKKEIVDPRDYRVSTKKAENYFKIKTDVSSLNKGIKEIANSIKTGEIKNPYSSIYYNIEVLREMRKK